MKILLLMLLFVTTLFLSLFSQIRYSGSSIATTNNALSVFYNPAGLGLSRGFNLFYIQNQAKNREIEDNGAVYAQFFGSSGFGVEWFKLNDRRIRSYHLATGLEVDRGIYLGFDYNWFENNRIYSPGFQFRPTPWSSIGGVWRMRKDFSDLLQWGFGIRPMGNRLTLGMDGKFDFNKKWNEDNELTGFVGIEFLDGMFLNGHYSNDSFGFSFQFNWRFLGYEIYNRFDDESNHLGGSMATYITQDRMRSFVQIPRSKWVQLNLENEIKEEPRPTGIFWKKPESIQDIISRIRALQKDDEVKGLVIRKNNLTMSAAGYEEIRTALDSFKRSGKSIWFYAENYGNLDYYLASVADSIIINPVGNINLVGLKIIKRYLKETLDKLGIAPQFERIGEHKTYSNQFTEETMPAEERNMLESMLDNLYENFVSKIAEGRNLAPDTLKELIDNAPYHSQMALQAGLIDTLLYEDQFQDLLKKQKIRLVKADDYFSVTNYQYDWEGFLDPEIALIYATGMIVSGENKSSLFLGNLMGSETIANAIRDARGDHRVKAIVLRIDSPGGEAAASEIIWREVFLTAHGEDKKPIIVSMGSTAASGGYLIACPSDTIIADVMTLTGSIGVVAGKFDFSGLLSKIGVNQKILKRGENATFYSSFASFTPKQKEKLELLIKEEYDSFVEKVAQGREMSLSSVDSIGRGRIWTGEEAKQLGLIDLTGDLETAIRIAKQLAHIPSDRGVEIRILPEYPFTISALLTNIFLKADGSGIKEISETISILQRLQEINYFLFMAPHVKIK